MESNLFLTDEELQMMTGYKQPSKQIAFLQDNFIKYIVNKKKRPIVFRRDISGQSATNTLSNVQIHLPVEEEIEPNFEALSCGEKKNSSY